MSDFALFVIAIIATVTVVLAWMYIDAEREWLFVIAIIATVTVVLAWMYIDAERECRMLRNEIFRMRTDADAEHCRIDD